MSLNVTSIQGECDPRYAGVRDAFASRIASGEDFGGSLCIIEDGRTVVDLWGGRADPAGTKAWQEDTIVNHHYRCGVRSMFGRWWGWAPW